MSRLGSGFSKLFAASAISNIGDGILTAALPLIVASITRDPVAVAMAMVAQTAPWFLLALLSGALVDRMDRRRVMVITDVARAGMIAGLAIAVTTDSINLPFIYAIAFALGVAETFFDTSAEAVVPNIVDGRNLSTANGRLQGAEWVGGALIGPPLGALLFGLAASLPFIVDAASFAIAALFIALIPGSFAASRSHDTIRAAISEGVRWLLNHRLLRTLAFMAAVTNFFATGVIATFVLYAQEILLVSDVGYGILLSGLGIGGLIGAIAMPRIDRAAGSGTTMRGLVFAQAALLGVFGAISNPWLAGIFMVGFGFTMTGWNVVSVSLRQELTPDDLRGRVSSASRMISWGVQPLGALTGGFIASQFGLRAPFFVAGAAFVLLLLAITPIVTNKTVEQARDANAELSDQPAAE